MRVVPVDPHLTGGRLGAPSQAISDAITDSRSSWLAYASDMASNVCGAIIALALAGIGLVGWLLPDRPISGFTGRRRSTCAIFCLVCSMFAVLAVLGLPIGRG